MDNLEQNLEQYFQDAVRDINNTTAKINPQTTLKLYGLYKQALFGDNTVVKPHFFYFNSCKKWYSWKAEKGKSKIQAKKEYIEEVNELFSNIYTY
jgi:diazepam-binding inhibitor (GABA receptor modulating acyl-CoA-binding protein)